MNKAKCDDELKVHMPSTLKEKLKARAKKRDRRGELSDYVRYVLTRHVIVEEAIENAEGAQRPN